eukprot:SAG25_NODE_13980_length_260_cov_0.968944_1_plen_39_part_01
MTMQQPEHVSPMAYLPQPRQRLCAQRCTTIARLLLLLLP